MSNDGVLHGERGNSCDDRHNIALPAEIILHVLNCFKEDNDLDYPTWAALALTSRLLCEEARRSLCRSVAYLGNHYTGPPPSIFASNPYLSRYLISCTIECDHESPSHPAWSILRPGPILTSMTNLKELFIKVGEEYPQDVLENCPFKLHSFSWYHNIQGADFANLPTFLEGQCELRHLQADWTYPTDSNSPQKPVAIPPTVCPNLLQLTGNRGIIEMVLPHRKISTLVWDPLWRDPTTSLDHLGIELSHLDTFSCYDSTFVTTPSLTTCIPYLQKLKFCHLNLLHWLEVGDVVYQMPSLVGLVLDRSSNPRTTWKELVKVFDHCRQLQFIDIYIDAHRDWRTRRRFSRWPRPNMLNVDSDLFSPPQVVEHRAMDIAEHIHLWNAGKGGSGDDRA